MAKGDAKRMENEIGTQGSNLQYGYGGTPSKRTQTGGIFGPVTTTPGTPGIGGSENLTKRVWDTNDKFMSNYDTAFSKGVQDYDSIMNDYRNFLGRNSEAKSAFTDLARGGGINEDAMRGRATNQVRSVYANAKRNLDRNKSIQGGYNPGYTTGLTRMAREQGQLAADASTNVEAAISELVSRNKALGAQGLAGLEGQDLSATNAMSSLFGTAPGMASMAGNQALASQGDILQNQSLMNQIAQLMFGARAQKAQIPSNFQQAVGNIGSVLKLGSQVVSPFASLGWKPFGNNDPIYGSGKDPIYG